MCGIISYIGHRQATEVIFKGLHRLEYRGYDSTGISLMQDGKITTFKKMGKVGNLEDSFNGDLASTHGIGHTRWATHGEPNDVNAHPHLDSSGKISLVHNGIIENHGALRTLLKKEGRSLVSDTDTEVLVEYISYIYSKGDISFPEAVRTALKNVVGAYGIVVMCEDNPDLLVAGRLGSPLVLGVGDGEMFIASDATPIVEFTREVIYLDDREMAIVKADSFEVRTIDGNAAVEKDATTVDLALEQIQKGGYPHFMLKEIFEQPETIPDAMRGRFDFSSGTLKLGGIDDYLARINEADIFYITACGTSWHAAQIGSYFLEELTGIVTKVEYASEFRYRETIVNSKTVVLAISQSGETADTLAAIKKANDQGAITIGVVNAVGSSISRETDCGVFIHAGPEIGVASTKAFTSQIMVLLLIAMRLAQQRGRDISQLSDLVAQLPIIGDKVAEILELSDSLLELAASYKDSSNFLYLGRGYQFPVALEGALKLKEISYIHAEGYPAAEMKHGPIALIDENMPVVVIAVKDGTYDKVLSNIAEIKARRGRVIVVTDHADDDLRAVSDHIIEIPSAHKLLMPLLTTIPLQLFAYHMAVLRNCDVDQPRNLAKSVTVE